MPTASGAAPVAIAGKAAAESQRRSHRGIGANR